MYIHKAGGPKKILKLANLEHFQVRATRFSNFPTIYYVKRRKNVILSL